MENTNFNIKSDAPPAFDHRKAKIYRRRKRTNRQFDNKLKNTLREYFNNKKELLIYST